MERNPIHPRALTRDELKEGLFVTTFSRERVGAKWNRSQSYEIISKPYHIRSHDPEELIRTRHRLGIEFPQSLNSMGVTREPGGRWAQAFTIPTEYFGEVAADLRKPR